MTSFRRLGRGLLFGALGAMGLLTLGALNDRGLLSVRNVLDVGRPVVPVGAPARASQGSCVMPTVGTVSGLTLVTDINVCYAAILTSNSGATAPANGTGSAPMTGQMWLDSAVSPNRLKIYDGTSWSITGVLDPTNHYWVPVWGGGVVQSVASASTTDICSSNINYPAYISITGTTTITSLGSSCQTGQMKAGVFTGVLTFTHNASSLILPNNGSNITTAAGDTFSAVHLGSGNWRVLNYQRASGSPLAASPTVQKFTSGTAATYTPTSGTVRILVRMVGGGGGGGALVTNNGANGGDTSFGSWTAIKGNGGVTGNGSTGGSGGTGGVDGTGVLVVRFDGGNGSGTSNTQNSILGGIGGAGPFGGAGAPLLGTNAGGNAKANTGAGGAGAGAAAAAGGSGGGAGEYVEFWITGPSATTYTVGAGGAGGAAGTRAGGNGAAGIIIIVEYYI